MQKPPPASIGRRLRGRYILAGAMMLTLWGASLVAPFRDGSAFNIVAMVFTTFTFLPLALIALWGGISGTETNMRRARNALLACGGLLALIVAAEVFRRVVFAGS